jgi:hypothetical protein
MTECCGWAIEKKRRILGADFEGTNPPQRGAKDTPDEGNRPVMTILSGGGDAGEVPRS